jgi:hypothetical protein
MLSVVAGKNSGRPSVGGNGSHIVLEQCRYYLFYMASCVENNYRSLVINFMETYVVEDRGRIRSRPSFIYGCHMDIFCFIGLFNIHAG